MAISTEIKWHHHLEAAPFLAYVGLVSGMSIDRASNTGSAILRAIGPLTGAHKTALRNLRLAFPKESETWRAKIADAMWDNIGRLAGEMPHMAAICRRESGRVLLEAAERFDAIKAAGRGVVFVSGHFANWEVMPATIAVYGVPCRMTYRPANNPIIDAKIQEGRLAYGAQLQAAKGKEGGMGLLRALASGISVAIMNDQKYNEGVAAPLFGHDCMTSDGPSRLAMRFKTDLVPMSLKRLGAGRFHTKVHAPIPIAEEGDEPARAAETVRRINAWMEARIREAPEHWFWVHRRWPKDAWKAAGVD